MNTSRDQFKVVILALSSNYRNFSIQNKAQFDYWYTMLGDIPYEQLQLAVNKHVSESEWPPTIADLRKAYVQAVTPEIPDANTAWGEVLRAIRWYGSYRPEEALESLSPVVRQVVRNMDYKDLCFSENQMADRAHFMKMYDAYTTREQKHAQLPQGVKQNMELMQSKVKQLSDKMSIDKL